MWRAAVLALLLLVVGVETRDETLVLQGSLAPAAYAYMGNGGGRELPVYWRPKLGALPIGYFPDGTRVEVLSSIVRVDGHRWVKVRADWGFEAWAYTRTLLPNPPKPDRPPAQYPKYASGLSWGGEIKLCYNPVGTPRTFSTGQFRDAVNRAIALWQEAAGGKIPIRNTGECDSDARDHGDGITAVGWGSPRGEDGKGLLGASWTRASGKRIVESDVELHSGMMGRRSGPAWLQDRDPQACLAQTLAHEIGHMIGLAHAPDGTESAMQAKGTCLKVSRLPEADAQNVRALYP